MLDWRDDSCVEMRLSTFVKNTVVIVLGGSDGSVVELKLEKVEDEGDITRLG